MPEVESKPWHQRFDEGESTKAFQAFEHYRCLSPALRSIDSAYRVQGPKGPQKAANGTKTVKRAPGRWKEWAKRFSWQARAAAYDAFVAEQRTSAAVDAMRSGSREIVQLHIDECWQHAAAQKRLRERLQELLNNEKKLKPQELSSIATALRGARELLSETMGDIYQYARKIEAEVVTDDDAPAGPPVLRFGARADAPAAGTGTPVSAAPVPADLP